MSRARTVFFVSVVVVASAVAGLAARGAGVPRSPLLPAEAAVLPADASFVAGLDVSRFVASPLYERVTHHPGYNPPDVWKNLQRDAGLTPERDFRQLLVAGSGAPQGDAVAIVVGTFERRRVEHALGAAPGLAGHDYKGRTLWVMASTPTRKESALAVIADGLIVAGTPDAVRAALDRHASHAPGLLSNAALLALVQHVPPEPAFWMCGDQGVMAAAATVAPGAGGWNMPSLKSVVASGRLSPAIAIQIIAETADAASAKSTAGMLQGFAGLFMMQAAQKPELGELLKGFEVSNEGARVTIAFHAAYDALERLMATATAAPKPSAAAPSPTGERRK